MKTLKKPERPRFLSARALKKLGIELVSGIAPVKRQREALGAVCLDCGRDFNLVACQPLPWKNMFGLHFSVFRNDHKYVLYGISKYSRKSSDDRVMR